MTNDEIIAGLARMHKHLSEMHADYGVDIVSEAAAAIAVLTKELSWFQQNSVKRGQSEADYLREITARDETIAALTRKLTDIEAALGLTPETEETHARHNLDGAYIDIERQWKDADKVCLRTLNRVMDQLVTVERVLSPTGDKGDAA